MEASPARPSYKDFPLTARGYFSACAGALCFGLAVGFLATALYALFTSSITLGRAVFGGGGPLFLAAAIFGPPPAYLRHSAASKAFFLIGLALSVYAWSNGFVPR
jgi:hypothetical protein